MKKYVVAAGVDLKVLEDWMNDYAEKGYKAIPPIIEEVKGPFHTYNILMELQDSRRTKT